MEDIENCQLVHGIIYDSLRVAFALSILSIGISVFSIITLYQIYVHEKQKIYFNRLNLLRKRIQQQQQQKIGENFDNQNVNYLNYLLPTAENGEAQLPIKCLSAEFSSQDLLLDQSSTNFGVTNAKTTATVDQSMPARIWSSQSSNFISNADCQSDFVDYNREANETNLRRYMSAIIDTSNSVQLFVRQKINSFKRNKSEQINYSRVRKNHIPPPHVLPRFSMANIETLGNRAGGLYVETSKQTMASERGSLSSSTYSSKSSSTKQPNSTLEDDEEDSDNLAQTSYFHPYALDLAQTTFDQNISTNVNSMFTLEVATATTTTAGGISSTNFSTSKSSQMMITSVSEKNDLFIKNGEYETNDDRWPPTVSLFDTFKCIDEDDCCDLDNFALDTSNLAMVVDVESPDSRGNSGRLTLASDPKFAAITTFEQAFKNYYDSQNRISNYFTLPLKKDSKELQRYKRKAQIQSNSQRRPVVIGELTNGVAPSNYPAVSHLGSCDDKRNCLKEPPSPPPRSPPDASLIVSDEMPFPAIEPPIDYQNVTAKEKNILLGGSIPLAGQQQQQQQQYQYWVEQFINQMNEMGDSGGKVNNQNSFEEYDTIANGFVDDEDEEDEEDEDDGAGDTSTSQDIADFELDFDDEPIKFLNDEECEAKMETTTVMTEPMRMCHLKQTVVSNKTEDKEEGKEDAGEMETLKRDELNLLQSNTNLIKHTTIVLQHNVTADYGFDGFRKGCAEDESSTSSESSLTNQEESITAEFIKPPTPFTNYYNLNN